MCIFTSLSHKSWKRNILKWKYRNNKEYRGKSMDVIYLDFWEAFDRGSLKLPSLNWRDVYSMDSQISAQGIVWMSRDQWATTQPGIHI